MTTRRPVGWHPSGVTPCHDPESFSSWRMSQGFMPPSLPPGRLFSYLKSLARISPRLMGLRTYLN